ncbi:hypothetical protein G6O67_007267 [Ophiocordyceps sinensis]|uniref:Uncharacterized protein n=1 Tax=Ophiocordyceps sinensis TaxID=72228 RepID=A0A8H4LTT6_9HYPO|nr:hypothetical protein G6O67_007267 [Ophiocordyceps sinensis]
MRVPSSKGEVGQGILTQRPVALGIESRTPPAIGAQPLGSRLEVERTLPILGLGYCLAGGNVDMESGDAGEHVRK